ncbi:unnamed protein product [Pleuronectes platessa]|uniref:Uncharacterized protein n=1 Tax=Pleuronectes platessa TaxID=8262 RepID=A0A9N7Z2D8_PLEPL|nr:unnamed protein product [Pleuronectes platessa]
MHDAPRSASGRSRLNSFSTAAVNSAMRRRDRLWGSAAAGSEALCDGARGQYDRPSRRKTPFICDHIISKQNRSHFSTPALQPHHNNYRTPCSGWIEPSPRTTHRGISPTSRVSIKQGAEKKD